MGLKTNWDFFGIATSVGCAIHCAILPLVASTLPVFGINIIHNPYFEWGMIALAVVVGVYSLYHGFVRHHRNSFPVLLFFCGVVFLVLKQFFPLQEYLFLVIAVAFIITAHVINYRYCRQSKVCNSPHHVH
jgi:hypothetical protein